MTHDSSFTPGVFTRWGIRLFGLVLLLWAVGVLYRATGQWRRWGELGEVLAGLSEIFGWTPEGWLAAMRGLIAFFSVSAVILGALGWGIWRRQAGAWLAVVALVLFSMFLTPLLHWLLWGPEAVKSYGWAGWSVHFAVWAVGGWFLLRRNTRRVFLKEEKLPWRSWWMAAPAAWIFFLALIPAMVIALKVVLYRAHGTPFWRADAVPQEIRAVAPEEGSGEWEHGDLYGFSFGMPVGARLIGFPRAEDRDWGMSVLATLEDGPRRVVIICPEAVQELIPASVLESLGVSGPIGYARAIYGVNWSLLPLAFSHLGNRPRAVFTVEDEKRQAVAIVEEGSAPERIMMRIAVHFPETDGMWEVFYSPVAREEDWAALAARKIGWMTHQEARDVPEPTEVGRDGAGDLVLLRTYWSGDLEAGLELTRRLIDRPEPRPRAAERILEEISAQAPEHPEIVALREALGALE